MSKKKRHPVKISGGKVEFLYNDKLRSLQDLGKSETKRASHVEPTINGTRWTADMTPSGGPILDNNGEGFETRQEALDAEVAWLETNKFKLKP